MQDYLCYTALSFIQKSTSHKPNYPRYICRDVDEDDIFVTVEEAAAYVMQELHMENDRAKQFVLTVDMNGDGMVSSVELVTLRDRIKDM